MAFVGRGRPGPGWTVPRTPPASSRRGALAAGAQEGEQPSVRRRSGCDAARRDRTARPSSRCVRSPSVGVVARSVMGATKSASYICQKSCASPARPRSRPRTGPRRGARGRPARRGMRRAPGTRTTSRSRKRSVRAATRMAGAGALARGSSSLPKTAPVHELVRRVERVARPRSTSPPSGSRVSTITSQKPSRSISSMAVSCQRRTSLSSSTTPIRSWSPAATRSAPSSSATQRSATASGEWTSSMNRRARSPIADRSCGVAPQAPPLPRSGAPSTRPPPRRCRCSRSSRRDRRSATAPARRGPRPRGTRSACPRPATS